MVLQKNQTELTNQYLCKPLNIMNNHNSLILSFTEPPLIFLRLSHSQTTITLSFSLTAIPSSPPSQLTSHYQPVTTITTLSQSYNLSLNLVDFNSLSLSLSLSLFDWFCISLVCDLFTPLGSILSPIFKLRRKNSKFLFFYF